MNAALIGKRNQYFNQLCDVNKTIWIRKKDHLIIAFCLLEVMFFLSCYTLSAKRIINLLLDIFKF
jgi:hypothetical protein